jgi:hypothetical protein
MSDIWAQPAAISVDTPAATHSLAFILFCIGLLLGLVVVAGFNLL